MEYIAIKTIRLDKNKRKTFYSFYIGKIVKDQDNFIHAICENGKEILLNKNQIQQNSGGFNHYQLPSAEEHKSIIIYSSATIATVEKWNLETETESKDLIKSNYELISSKSFTNHPNFLF